MFAEVYGWMLYYTFLLHLLLVAVNDCHFNPVTWIAGEAGCAGIAGLFEEHRIPETASD